MQTLFNIINIPFGWALEFLSSLFGGNFAAAGILFHTAYKRDFNTA